MITIYRCRLENDQWQRIERLHVGHGFDSMAHATEYAEAKNRQRWPGFDWIKSPQEAFLAFRE
jgi:hypothetical protein